MTCGNARVTCACARSVVKYTKTHEWLRVDGKLAKLGITDYGQKALGEVVYVETPEQGRQLAAGGKALVA